MIRPLFRLLLKCHVSGLVVLVFGQPALRRHRGGGALSYRGRDLPEDAILNFSGGKDALNAGVHFPVCDHLTVLIAF